MPPRVPGYTLAEVRRASVTDERPFLKPVTEPVTAPVEAPFPTQKYL